MPNYKHPEGGEGLISAYSWSGYTITAGKPRRQELEKVTLHTGRKHRERNADLRVLSSGFLFVLFCV